MSHDIKCPNCTHKIIAKEHDDGMTYVFCKQCRIEVPLPLYKFDLGLIEKIIDDRVDIKLKEFAEYLKNKI